MMDECVDKCEERERERERNISIRESDLLESNIVLLAS